MENHTNPNSDESNPPGFFAQINNKYKIFVGKYPLLNLLIIFSFFILTTVISAIISDKSTTKYKEITEEGDKYIAVAITNLSDETFTIPQEFRKGFGNNSGFESSASKQRITYKFFDDLLSDEQAKIIATQLINDPNCVLIIGNSTSSLTEVTLNSILSSKETKPGFILPIATADNIIAKAKDQNYNAILRMMPNNEKQAIAIKNFIFKNYENPKVAILVDEENLTYSKNLSQKISDKLISEKGNGGTVVLKKNYGNSNRFIDNYELLKLHSQLPDIIVFVGISTNGSLLMEELENLNLSIPIIFTDGCTVNTLMNSAKDYPNYYFVSAVQKPSNETDAPTYQPVGEDAQELSKLIIDGVEEEITRESVATYISTIKKGNSEIMSNGKAGKYRFDFDGENASMFWNVYHYVNGKLKLEYESK